MRKTATVIFSIVGQCPFWRVGGTCVHRDARDGGCVVCELDNVPEHCPCDNLLEVSRCHTCERGGACDTQDMVQNMITVCKGYLEKKI
jgi:hypothetical protein